MTTASSPEPPSRLPVDALAEFAVAALLASGLTSEDAELASAVLVLADRRGIPSHGIARLGFYVDGLLGGAMNPRPRERVERAFGPIELWNADHGLGAPVSRRAMTRVIILAREHGIGWVAVRESSHFGIAAAYVEQATRAGMVGIAMTNADPVVAPTGSVERVLGTNPIAIGAPGNHGTAFLLDMATSVVPSGRLEVAARNGCRIPSGWAIDATGRESHDPAVLTAGGAMLPLGGPTVEGGGHKGYGLAAAVDLLCGVLPMTGSLRDAHSLYSTHGPCRVGHTFIALDPTVLDPSGSFPSRVDVWRASLKAAVRAPGVAEVLLAGEPEARAEKEHVRTVPVDEATIRALGKLGDRLGIRPLPVASRPGHGARQEQVRRTNG